MLKKLCVLVLVCLAMIAVPMAAVALSLDVEAKGGAGVALGSTDNSSVTGSARLAALGGIGVDLYLLTAGPVDLGISTGVDYSYLTTHSTWTNFQGAGTDQTSDATYNYVNIPIALVGRMPVGPVSLLVRAGAFIGFFLNGKTDLSYSVQFGPFTNGPHTFDSNDVESMNYGLHFTAGADIGLMQNVTLAPAVQFDMGLTDTTPNNVNNGTFKDTLWSLTVVVGIKYNVL
jgi:hypothetical protein